MSLQLLLWDVSGFPAYASGTTHGNWRPQRSPPHLAPLVPFYATKKLLPTEHLLDQSSARCMALHVNVLMCLYVSLKHGCKCTNACSVTMWGVRLYYDVPIKLYVLSIKMHMQVQIKANGCWSDHIYSEWQENKNKPTKYIWYKNEDINIYDHLHCLYDHQHMEGLYPHKYICGSNIWSRFLNLN